MVFYNIFYITIVSAFLKCFKFVCKFDCMKEDRIFDKLNEMIKSSKGGFSILEEQIDVDLQVEFFELINELAENKPDDDAVIEYKNKLYDSEIAIEEKKKLLAKLSVIEKPEAYRMIEDFLKEGEQDLRSWAILSLQHCRISLETSLLDEDQVFISTGLGGKGEKLRYFIVGKLKQDNKFTDSQKKIIQSEFEHFFKNNNSEIEKLEFKEIYFTITGLIPIKVAMSEVISSAISEINQYGNFINKEYLITNVKILTEKEIELYFNKKEDK